MEINFAEEARKRNKLNRLFNLCRELIPKSTEGCCELASKHPGIQIIYQKVEMML